MIKGAAPWISMPPLPEQKHQQQEEEEEDKYTQEAIRILRNIKNIFMQKVFKSFKLGIFWANNYNLG